MKNYEKWLWIDLIGFDNKKPDLGVKQFLGNLGFIPDAVSLFLPDPDFVHSFKANEQNRIFPESYCSYGAHYRNAERKRQRWTKVQLEGLIRELRNKSIKVFFSVFNGCSMSNDDHLAYMKLKKRPVWMDNHPEIFNILYSGERSSSICSNKRLADAGVDGFVIEAPAGAMELMDAKSPRPLYDFMATIMLIKAYIPKTKLIQMNAFNDTNEQWSTLRHAPLLLETDVYSLPNVFWYDAGTRIRRCLSGILACLAAGITKAEWAWIKKIWDRGFATEPKNISGATLIVSGDLFAGQIDDYLKTRKWSVHKIFYHLLARGAQIYAICDVINIGRLKGPVLIIQPHLFSKTELAKALAYRGGPVVFIGSEPINAGAIPPGVSKTKTGWFCSVYQSGRKPGQGASVADHWSPGNEHNNGAGRDIVVSTGNEHLISWLDDLPGEKIPDGFLDKCAQVIGSVSGGGAEVISGKGDVNIMSVGIKKGMMRVFLWNNKNTYFTPKIDAGADIKSIRVITEFPLLHVHWAKKSDFRDRADFYKGSIFKVIIPPKGMTVLDINF